MSPLHLHGSCYHTRVQLDLKSFEWGIGATVAGRREVRGQAERTRHEGPRNPGTARAVGAAKKQLRRCQAQHSFCPYGAAEVECSALIDRAAGELEQMQPQPWGQVALSLYGRQIENGCPRIVSARLVCGSS